MATHEVTVPADNTEGAASNWIRRSGIAAALAGVLYILSAPIEALYPVAIFGGTVFLGIATVRAGVLPRWCGVVLVLFFPSIFVGGLLPGLGTFLPGLIWLALGYALWTESSGNNRVNAPTNRKRGSGDTT